MATKKLIAPCEAQRGDPDLSKPLGSSYSGSALEPFLKVPGWFVEPMEAIAMKYLAAIGIAAFVAGAGLAVYSVGSPPPEKQSTPTVTQLVVRLAQSVDPFLLQSRG
jgi:hypothetical protein